MKLEDWLFIAILIIIFYLKWKYTGGDIISPFESTQAILAGG